jgi:asparagine synthase (glutamine-hydrolysing)
MGEKYNEIPLARRLADSVGLENISQNITADEYFAALQDVQYFMDEPLADPAAVPLYFATRLAAENGIKVLLSGEGADELFAGYGVYQQPIHTAGYRALPLGLRRWIAGLAEKMQPGRRGRAMLMRGAQPIEEHYIGGAYVFSPQELETLLIAPPHKYPEDITRPYYDRVRYEDEITKMQCLDISLWLPGDILAKADKMAAAHGITIRTPLACREVLRAATRLPLKFRVGKHETKIAFRRAAGAHIPTETAERPKLGFPVPLAQWLRDEKYIAPIRDAFNGDTAQEYFHTVSLTTLLDTHSSGKRDLSRGIWAIYCFLVWHDEYFHEKNQQ